MLNLIQQLIKDFTQATAKAFPSLEQPLVEVTQATQDKFGHYQCNSALKLTKILEKNPREIAAAIIENLSSDLVEKTEIAGPGFINIFLKNNVFNSRILAILADPRLGIEAPRRREKIVIDFSSPNIAKEMHVGHLRSTIIGDSLARLFEFLGYEVLRLNHVGDWGTAFGMLIAYMKEKHAEILTGSSSTDLSHLVHWYKESKVRFDSDPEFKKQSQLEVVALQSGDPASIYAWEIICAISRQAYQEIYDLLDIQLIERGESFYNPLLKKLVADVKEKGVASVSEGATCIFLDGFKNRDGEPLPFIIEKSDGGYNYATTDLAAIRHRIEEEHADRIIYVTDAGQQTHFQMLFQAATRAGYLDPKKTRVDHVPFGLVLGADGKKFRTRSGDTEKLIDLITTAEEYAAKVVADHNPSISEEEKKQLAHVLAISSIKYADLSCNRIGDYNFSYERMLRFDGNTAVFLLYCYVRVAGIKRKIQKEIGPIIAKGLIDVQHPSEIALALHLARFGEALQIMDNELLPNKLCDYLYNLADKFNAFFRDCRVEGSKEEESRLLLCEATARVMRQGLGILGVQTVEKM